MNPRIEARSTKPLPGKGLAALARVLMLIAASLVVLVLVGPPVAVWVGALLVVLGLALPFALNTHPDDLYDDGLEWGLILLWPLIAIGAAVLAISIPIWVF